jgi:hypothetical protein
MFSYFISQVKTLTCAIPQAAESSYGIVCLVTCTTCGCPCVCPSLHNVHSLACSVQITRDKSTGASRRFGFIEFETADSASDAVRHWNQAQADWAGGPSNELKVGFSRRKMAETSQPSASAPAPAHGETDDA